MALHGHSYGGYEVNYIITRTNIFACAASSAGGSNIVSMAGSLMGYVHDSHQHTVSSQPYMKQTLWENQSIYIKNSPLFFADKVTSPLLIMHNKLDPAVVWTQGIEYYTALRYLKKKVWMLQYDNSGHTLNEEADMYDYTVRLKQYFDHYLKNKPAQSG